MKPTKTVSLSAALTAAIFCAAILCASCVMVTGDDTGSGYIASELRGTWETETPTSPAGYKGKIELERDTIKISGYTGGLDWLSTPPYNDDEATRPFGDFAKGSELEAHSEKTKDLISPSYEGTLLIVSGGKEHEIPFVYSRNGTSSGNYTYYLEFVFGGKLQRLKQTSEY